MEFSTLKQNALLLYSLTSGSSSEFIALEIVNGNVRFSFALGDGAITRVVVNRNVADGKWHRITVERFEKVGSMIKMSLI